MTHVSPTFNDNTTATSLSFRSITSSNERSKAKLKIKSKSKPRPAPISIPSPQKPKLLSSNTFTRSISRDIVPPPIPKKLLHGLGVDPLTKLTVTLMKNGEKFKMYYPSGSSIICKLFLNSENNGLIGDDLAIKFSNIVALYAGKYDKYPSINPSASFMIEYKLDDIDTKCILLEITHTERYLARRNWWINSIISCIANCEPYRVPPSISSITKMLSSITDDSEFYKLTFVDINDIEESFSMSISFDSTYHSNDVNAVTTDIEMARKKAVDRVKKYKKLQRDIQNMTRQSKVKQQNKMNEIATSINIDSIPFDDDDEITNKSHNSNEQELQDQEQEQEQEHEEEKKCSTTDKIQIVINDDGSQSGKNSVVDGNEYSQSNNQHLNNESLIKSPNSVNQDIETQNNTNSKAYDSNSIRFATNEDAVKMRSTIIHLTQKLQYMENLQMTQNIKMQKFIQKESVAIKRYENEIKRLKKENKQLGFKVKDITETKTEIEKQMKLQQWNKKKSEQNKNKKLKTMMSQMNDDMEGLYDKLEKKESGYNAAIQNYNREKKQKQRLEREYNKLEQRYVCDTQQIKDESLQLTQKHIERKRNSKKMRASLSHSSKRKQIAAIIKK